jgi:murein DD-endopeptidase MepM/ murein hydrolase activator NlpD
VSVELDALITRARQAAAEAGDSSSNAQRQQLAKIAAEFESMLMTQVLKDMRRAAKWDDEEEEGTSETQSLFEMADVELASALSKAQGFGLSRQLLEAFDRMDLGGTKGVAGASPSPAIEAPAIEGPAKAGHYQSGAPEVTSHFGWRRDPLTGAARFHQGVDLKAAYGQDVQSAGNGRVVFAGSQGGYGTTVMVEHGDGTRTRYAHLSVALVAAGDTVAAGQTLGQAGSSGRSTGPHLHFEVLGPDGKALDPLKHRVS